MSTHPDDPGSRTSRTRGLFKGVQKLFAREDSTLLFAPSHTADLGRRVAQALGMELARSEEREYENGEHKMRPLDEVRSKHAVVVQSLCGDEQASTHDKLCRLLFFIGALKDAGALSVTACTPYLAYARKDRRTKSRDPVTTRYIAAMFEAVGVDRVMVLDVHNESSFDNAFRCQSVRIDATTTFAEEYARVADISNVIVASPDIGGVKRAQGLRDLFGKKLGKAVDFAFMEKRRSGGVVSGDTLTGPVSGRDVVIYDDMIATGTTVLRATAAARHAGARRVDIIATHAAFTPDVAKLFEPGGADSVFVSDSIALRPPFTSLHGRSLHVVSIAPLLARAIRDLA
jgi:ribose-phosphate pyrophosphokinase